MYIFRTKPEHIEQVIATKKHALEVNPKLQYGELVLISRTRDTADGKPPIRYVMRHSRTLPDLHDETVRIWGKKWPYIMEFETCKELTPFDIKDVQVSAHNYGPGGPIVRVMPEDEYQIETLGLLK